MIFPLGGLVIGAVLGVLLARRHEGKRADMVQFGVVGALIFGVIGVFILVFIERAFYEPADPAEIVEPDTGAETAPESDG